MANPLTQSCIFSQSAKDLAARRLLARQSGYDVNKLAALVGMSVRRLQRRFKMAHDRCPQDWLNEERILAAQHLLLQFQVVKIAASELGYKDETTFYRHFKRAMGMTPRSYILSQVREGSSTGICLFL